MRLLRTTHFDRSYSKATKEIQQAFDKQSLLLLQNLRYPFLHAKKIDETNDILAGPRDRGLALPLSDRR
jgi:hypothetical protein